MSLEFVCAPKSSFLLLWLYLFQKNTYLYQERREGLTLLKRQHRLTLSYQMRGKKTLGEPGYCSLLVRSRSLGAMSWMQRNPKQKRKPNALFFVSFTFLFCLLEQSCKIFASFFGDYPSESSYKKCLLFNISNIIYT